MKKPIKEKKTGEKYTSKAAMAKHEKSEGAKERMKEYGPQKFAKGGAVKGAVCMACGGMIKKGK